MYFWECLEDSEILKDWKKRKEKIILKEENGVDKELETIQTSLNTPRNDGIKY